MRMRMYKVYCTLQPHCRQASGARGPQHKRTHAPHADRGDEHRARGDEARHLRRAGDPPFESRQPAREDRAARWRPWRAEQQGILEQPKQQRLGFG